MVVHPAKNDHHRGTHKRKRVSILNKHGEKFVGILHETGSKELVIICHGFRSTKDCIPMVNLAAAFEKEGISAFRLILLAMVKDHFSMVTTVEKQMTYFQWFDISKERRLVAALVGHSKGGNAVLLYASSNNDIQLIVNIAGRFDLKREIEGRLGKDYLEIIEQRGFIDVKSRRGKTEYRVTEESLMDRLTTDSCAGCETIDKNCK